MAKPSDRQLSVRQNNTKHAAGTPPLNMYRKELPVGDRVTEEPSLADDIGDQLSEYDSDSSNEEDSATHEEDAVEAVPVNFLSKTVRTRTGRQITLSYRALSSYWGTKSYFFLQKPLKTRVNSKYQSKGSTYILHLLAFVEIRLFNVFFWERKAGFGKLMKNVRDAGFSRKRGGNAGPGPPPSPTPFPDPVCKSFIQWFWVLNLCCEYRVDCFRVRPDYSFVAVEVKV